MRTFIALLLLVAVAYGAKLLATESRTAIPGTYIVVLNANVNGVRHIRQLKSAIEAAADASYITYTYNMPNFVGYAANLSDAMLQKELAHPDVSVIEVDQVVTAYATTTQHNAVWGLARIDKRKLPHGTTFIYNSTTEGAKAAVYVIDTGIHTLNVDFEKRASSVYNAVTNEGPDDLNGHGTHCAGTVGGSLYGVAKQVALYGVKVLNAAGSGTWAGVIAGINYVTNNRAKNIPTVASMSLGGGASATLDAAVDASIATGVIYVVAAGNDNFDACSYSPARVPLAITVGATDATDRRASYSNYGKCVDIFAPGTNIKSDWIGSNTATATISGTSMATPHVSGVLALHLSDYPQDATTAAATAWLKSVATQGVVTNHGTGSPNTFLYAPY